MKSHKQAAIFQRNKDQIRKNLLKYMRKAFRMLPKIEAPRILDIGCGTGVPTIELAKLTGGEVIGLDIDQSALDILNNKIAKAGLSHRVRTINRSLDNMEFPDRSFDIIWAEGSIYNIGFARGIREWKRFLKPNGQMVIHDAGTGLPEKLKLINDHGYKLLGYFTLGTGIWHKEYFTPLETLVGETQKHTTAPAVIEELNKAQHELKEFSINPANNSSVYFVMMNMQLIHSNIIQNPMEMPL